MLFDVMSLNLHLSNKHHATAMDWRESHHLKRCMSSSLWIMLIVLLSSHINIRLHYQVPLTQVEESSYMIVQHYVAWSYHSLSSYQLITSDIPRFMSDLTDKLRFRKQRISPWKWIFLKNSRRKCKKMYEKSIPVKNKAIDVLLN